MAGSRLDFSTGAIINPFSQTQSALESISNTIGSISKQYLDKQQHEERMAESKAAREESNNRFAQEMAANRDKFEYSKSQDAITAGRQKVLDDRATDTYNRTVSTQNAVDNIPNVINSEMAVMQEEKARLLQDAVAVKNATSEAANAKAGLKKLYDAGIAMPGYEQGIADIDAVAKRNIEISKTSPISQEALDVAKQQMPWLRDQLQARVAGKLAGKDIDYNTVLTTTKSVLDNTYGDQAARDAAAEKSAIEMDKLNIDAYKAQHGRGEGANITINSDGSRSKSKGREVTSLSDAATDDQYWLGIGDTTVEQLNKAANVFDRSAYKPNEILNAQRAVLATYGTFDNNGKKRIVDASPEDLVAKLSEFLENPNVRNGNDVRTAASNGSLTPALDRLKAARVERDANLSLPGNIPINFVTDKYLADRLAKLTPEQRAVEEANKQAGKALSDGKKDGYEIKNGKVYLDANTDPLVTKDLPTLANAPATLKLLEGSGGSVKDSISELSDILQKNGTSSGKSLELLKQRASESGDVSEMVNALVNKSDTALGRAANQVGNFVMQGLSHITAIPEIDSRAVYESLFNNAQGTQPLQEAVNSSWSAHQMVKSANNSDMYKAADLLTNPKATKEERASAIAVLRNPNARSLQQNDGWRPTEDQMEGVAAASSIIPMGLVGSSVLKGVGQKGSEKILEALSKVTPKAKSAKPVADAAEEGLAKRMAEQEARKHSVPDAASIRAAKQAKRADADTAAIKRASETAERIKKQQDATKAADKAAKEAAELSRKKKVEAFRKELARRKGSPAAPKAKSKKP